ncbi:hypothetical protein [Rubritalea profundi]|uniref:hypothetical protein n=1 Tax=Rubritalea profundi TaxID=1658618 RepID=UPI0013FDFB80|nr:hypothetical protein [Rubritalea profundi]
MNFIHLVDIWSLHVLVVTVTTDIGIAHVIHQNEDDVRLGLLGCVSYSKGAGAGNA